VETATSSWMAWARGICSVSVYRWVGAEAERGDGVRYCGGGARVGAGGGVEEVVVLGAGVAAGDLGGGEAGVDVGLFGEGVGLPGGGFGVQGGPTAGAEDEGFVDDTLVGFHVVD
jgi:hypothetical protein